VDEKGRKVKTQEVLDMPPWTIHPFNPYYRCETLPAESVCLLRFVPLRFVVLGRHQRHNN